MSISTKLTKSCVFERFGQLHKNHVYTDIYLRPQKPANNEICCLHRFQLNQYIKYWIKLTKIRERKYTAAKIWLQNWVKLHLNECKNEKIVNKWDPCAFQFRKLVIFIFRWWSIRRKSFKIHCVYNVGRYSLKIIQYFQVYCIELVKSTFLNRNNFSFLLKRFKLFDFDWKVEEWEKWQNSPFSLLLSFSGGIFW